MAVKNGVYAVPLTALPQSSITNSYAPINPNGLPNACFMIRIINELNAGVVISYDGVTDHEYVPTDSSILLNFQTNAQPNTYIANLAAGTKVYVRGIVSSGSIYLVGYYQSQGM